MKLHHIAGIMMISLLAAGAHAAPVEIIGYENGGILTFQGGTISNYFSIEYATSLAGPWTNWGSLSEQPITGNVMLAAGPMFFRIATTDHAIASPYMAEGVDREGLFIENDSEQPTNALEITTRGLNVGGIFVSNVDLMINISTNGANGLDTGTVATSTWYYAWIIYADETADVAGLLSISAESPALPDGYGRKRLVGVARTDAAGALIKTYQSGLTVMYDELITKAVSGGNDWTVLDLTDAIPPISRIAAITTFHAGGVQPASYLTIYIRPDGSTSANQYFASLYSGYQTTTGDIVTSREGRIEYRVTNNGTGGSITLYISGFVLNL